jgi:Icc-related predicted phosphoesterase
MQQIKICAISDIHEQWRSIHIPKCDLLIIAGDLTYKGSFLAIKNFLDWISELKKIDKIKQAIVIAGNHDLTAQNEPEKFEQMMSEIIYLKDELYEYEGLRIYGAPWSPSFYREYGWVFNADRGEEIRGHWSKIPENLDILITHTPMHGVLDTIKDGSPHLGCEDLRDAILEKKPKVHICGHIHGGYGISQFGSTLCINASSCNEQYFPKNDPILFSIVGKNK